jgi:hypothetical protein
VQKVQEEAVESWAYHRFLLIVDYSRKSMLPPPFSLISYLIDFFKDCRNDSKV